MNARKTLPLLIIPLLLLAPATSVFAAGTQITTYTIPIIYTLTKTVQLDPANPNATAAFTLLYANPQQVIVEYNFTTSDTNGTVQLCVEDGEGHALKTVSLGYDSEPGVIPLKGSDVGDEVVVRLSATNLSTVWEGTIKVTVVDPTKFEVSIAPSEITVERGSSAQADIQITQKSGPAGRLSFMATFDTNKITGSVSNPLLYTSGAGWSGTTQLKITATQDCPPGTYKGTVKVYFYTGVSSELDKEGVEVADITLTFDVNGGGGGGRILPVGSSDTMVYAVGAGIVLILFVVLITSVGRRR